MKAAVKLILFVILLAHSAHLFGQSETRERTEAEIKAYKEAAAREEAQRKAEADKKKASEAQALKKLFEQQSKSESSQAKLSESASATVHAKAEAFYSLAMSQINAKHIAWIKQYAKKTYTDKLDELSIKVMVRYYVKNEGLSEQTADGLLLLLMNETYRMVKKDYRANQDQLKETEQRNSALQEAQKVLSDSSRQLSKEDLQKINGLLVDSVSGEKMVMEEQSQALSRTENLTAPSASRKQPDQSMSLSELSLTRTKLAENITALNQVQEERSQRMQDIERRQQKLTLMMSKLVNQVTESREKIIAELK